MTASSGNSFQSDVAATEPRLATAVRELPPVSAEGKRGYRKPALRRLGRLRSVTGSDLKW